MISSRSPSSIFLIPLVLISIISPSSSRLVMVVKGKVLLLPLPPPHSVGVACGNRRPLPPSFSSAFPPMDLSSLPSAETTDSSKYGKGIATDSGGGDGYVGCNYRQAKGA